MCYYSRPLSFARIFENLTPFPRERERERELKEEREQNEFPEEEIQQMGEKKAINDNEHSPSP